jgi:hypothetical protein
MKLLIIQTSPTHTASTLLVNAIYGLIPELHDKKIMFDQLEDSDSENIIVLKRHDDIDVLIDKYDKLYKLIFICSERKDLDIVIDVKYRKYTNVVIFDYNELNETINNELLIIVNTIYNKVKYLLSDIKLNKITCIERIKSMNTRYEEIKNNSFDYIDDFFGLHGSHRNRIY